MSTSRNINKPHKTRLKNCKGVILGDISNLSENDFVYWIPEKNYWYTQDKLNSENINYKNLLNEYKENNV